MERQRNAIRDPAGQLAAKRRLILNFRPNAMKARG
jgi:hypothetical protein